eukprot:355656-Chlamydomonas_euryale.AAC.8
MSRWSGSGCGGGERGGGAGGGGADAWHAVQLLVASVSRCAWALIRSHAERLLCACAAGLCLVAVRTPATWLMLRIWTPIFST